MSKKGLIVFIFLLAGMNIIFFKAILSYKQTIEAKTPIITVKQLQAQLVQLGYDIQVDGKVCSGWNVPSHSETITAWQKAEIEQMAQPIMEQFMKGK